MVDRLMQAPAVRQLKTLADRSDLPARRTRFAGYVAARLPTGHSNSAKMKGKTGTNASEFARRKGMRTRSCFARFSLLLGVLGMAPLAGCDWLSPIVDPCRITDLCCDPASKPGTGDNPTCFEGVRCCANGEWSCNEGDGSSTCAAEGCECEEVCGGIQGIQCRNPDHYCKMNEGECCCDFQGLCVPKPEICIELFEPVCGCDGVTYSNACFAAAAGVNVHNSGECAN